MNVPQAYLNRVREILDHLETTQLDAVGTAAGFVVDALRHDGAVYCWRLGHGIEGDSIHRAGGLVAVKTFSYRMQVNAEVPACQREERQQGKDDADLKRVRFAVESGPLRAGDVILISSVSGKNREPIELALACRDAGIKVITLSSLSYTAEVTSLHPSGKKLFEAGDINIDIGAPYGDAAVTVPGLDIEVMPVSGVAMAVSAWMLWGRVMEVMGAAGEPPSVLMSVNRDGGPEYNEQSKKRFAAKGF